MTSVKSLLGTAYGKNIVVILGDHTLPDPIKRDGLFNPEDFQAIEVMKVALFSLEEYNFIFLDNHRSLLSDLESVKDQIWLVINFCDEGNFNDPRREKDIPLMLEQLGVPYTGAAARCMERCYDKSAVFKLAANSGVPIPKTYDFWEDIKKFPVIIKPNFGDGGLGITAKSVVNNQAEYLRAVNFLRQEVGYQGKIIIQEFLTGQDLTCGIVAGEVLPVIEEDYSCLPPDLPPIQGYEAKWQPDSPYWQVKSNLAAIPDSTKRIISDYTRLMFETLGCQDYARIDWRLDTKGFPRFLEVNPNPGWCWDGHLAKTWNLLGRNYPKMLLAIIESAAKRYGLK